MSETLPTLHIARHGETAGSLSDQHTGLADLPLIERGERNARHLELLTAERMGGNLWTGCKTKESLQGKNHGIFSSDTL